MPGFAEHGTARLPHLHRRLQSLPWRRLHRDVLRDPATRRDAVVETQGLQMHGAPPRTLRRSVADPAGLERLLAPDRPAWTDLRDRRQIRVRRATPARLH